MLLLKLVKIMLVYIKTLALPDDAIVPVQTKLLQRTQDLAVCVRDCTGRVDIFDADQPLTTLGFGVQITANCGD